MRYVVIGQELVVSGFNLGRSYISSRGHGKKTEDLFRRFYVGMSMDFFYHDSLILNGKPSNRHCRCAFGLTLFDLDFPSAVIIWSNDGLSF